jgi:hypothetical protein
MSSFLLSYFVQLSAHPDSAKVLDFLFASAKQKEQLSLLQEFYSPEFVVFGADESLQGKSLAEIVQAKPEKKMQMLENLRKVSSLHFHAQTTLHCCIFSPFFLFFQ